MGEALRNRTEQYQELLSTVIKLKESWLNNEVQEHPSSILISYSAQNIPRLRAYVRDKKPDIKSLRYNAIVGIAFYEDVIISEIHYPFHTEKTITSFTALDLSTELIRGYDLIDENLFGPKIQYQDLDPFEQTKKLIELVYYFKRIGNFSIPYETKYINDLESANTMRSEVRQLFPIKPYVFETPVFK